MYVFGADSVSAQVDLNVVKHFFARKIVRQVKKTPYFLILSSDFFLHLDSLLNGIYLFSSHFSLDFSYF